MKHLLEIHALSGNNVNTLEQVKDFLQAKMFGGEFKNGVKIQGRLGAEVQGNLYNAMLSSPQTPLKAIVGTNLVAVLRPFSAYAGAALRLNFDEMAVSASMIAAIKDSLKESFDMFRHNWDLGLNRKTQTYDTRFSLSDDLADWNELGKHIEHFGTDAQKRSYFILNQSVNFNTSPLVKYSANAMGAGDALARTVIGRMEMRHRAMRAALAKGFDPTKAKKIARQTEEEFRDQIFKLGRDNKWVVHDKAATIAGDEAALTTALEGVARSMESVTKQPIIRSFIPFVRTGINALDLTFKHTPFAVLQKKTRDILSGKNLDAYGIRPQDAAQAKALIEGRMAIGSALSTYVLFEALEGNITGDYPSDKETRANWKLNNIQPYSVRLGNNWYSYQHLEPFNTVIAFSANIAQNADILGEGLTENWARKGSFLFTSVIVDKSMLSGVRDMMELITVEKYEGGTQKNIVRTLARKLRPLVLPYAGLSKTVAEMRDGVIRENETLLEQIQVREAFFKEQLPPKYDILNKDRSGVPLNRGALNPYYRIFNAISPVAIVPVQEDDLVRQTILEMRYDIPSQIRTIDGIKLNSAQRSEFQRILATSDLRNDLERIIYPNSMVLKDLERYKQGNLDTGKPYTSQTHVPLKGTKAYKLINKVFLKHINQAKLILIQNDRQLKQEIDLAKTKTLYTKGGYYNRIDKLSSPPPNSQPAVK